MALPDGTLRQRAANCAQPADRSPRGPGDRGRIAVGLAPAPRRHPAGGLRPPRPGAAHRAPTRLPARAVHPLSRGHPGAARPSRSRRPHPLDRSPRGSGPPGAEHGARLRPLLRGHTRRRVLRSCTLGLPPACGHAGRAHMTVQLLDRRLESLWADGLSDSYRSYLDAVVDHRPDAQPKLALAAALIEVGLRLQGLGGRAAPPPTLLMGDLCLARASRLLADAAGQSLQVAFAQAIETLSVAAASGQPARPVRELLVHALTAAR